MQTKDELMDTVRKELSDAIESVTKTIPPSAERIPLLDERTSPEPGSIGYVDADGKPRFDGLLKETELGSVEAIAEAIEKKAAEVQREREERGRVSKGAARPAEV